MEAKDEFEQGGSRAAGVDIVIWGATGFVGRLLAAYMWSRCGKTDAVRLALGGRSEAELEALHRELQADERLPLIVGDAFDADFLDEMTRKARVVVSTVGPYAKYGSPLVAACVKNGCDYCDLSGEPQWMQQMIQAHQKEAEASGARLVPACGFDAIPSDLGVFFLQSEARRRFGHALNRVKMRVQAMRGGISGGTVASMIHLVEASRKDPEVLRILKNPYVLAPEGMQSGVRQPNVSRAAFDADLGSWLAPFVMAAVNTRIVHRSNALRNHAFGRFFKYDEAMMTGEGKKGRLRATWLAALTGAFFLGAAFAPTRDLMKRFVLPKPGEGPSPEKQEKGFFKLIFIGSNDAGKQLRARVEGDRDPGYGGTCRMLGESAVCLLQDIAKEDLAGGFWTPSTAMGEVLVERLSANAGLRFEIGPA